MIGSNAAITVTFFGAAASVAWSATVAWGYWLKHRFDTPPTPNRDGTFSDDARLAQLEAAVDTLSIELERMGEAQRFTVRLLEERLPVSLPPKTRPIGSDPGRVITPH